VGDDLRLLYMGARKYNNSDFEKVDDIRINPTFSACISVLKKDEGEIRDWLKLQWNTMKDLWNGVSE